MPVLLLPACRSARDRRFLRGYIFSVVEFSVCVYLLILAVCFRFEIEAVWSRFLFVRRRSGAQQRLRYSAWIGIFFLGLAFVRRLYYKFFCRLNVYSVLLLFLFFKSDFSSSLHRAVSFGVLTGRGKLTRSAKMFDVLYRCASGL